MFKLFLDDEFEIKWKTLFPESKVSREKITKDPWSLVTISDMSCKEIVNKEEDEEYVAYYRKILLSLGPTAASYRQPVLRSSSFPLFVKCKRPRFISFQGLRNEGERLYNLARDMVNVLEETSL